MHKSLLIFFAILYVTAMFYFQSIQWLPSWSLIFLTSVNLLSVIFYGMDKLAAIKRWQRTPEKHFYCLALLSGWPGSLVGQRLFNHKTTKPAFRRLFYLMVFINLILTIGYLVYVNNQ